MTESMADFLNLHPNLNTRTRRLMAETRDLKVCSPANHPVSGFPLLDCIPTAIRQPLTPAMGRAGSPNAPNADGSESRPYLAAPANYPVSGFPLSGCIPNRQPLTANRHHPHQTKDPGEPGSCSSL